MTKTYVLTWSLACSWKPAGFGVLPIFYSEWPHAVKSAQTNTFTHTDIHRNAQKTRRRVVYVKRKHTSVLTTPNLIRHMMTKHTSTFDVIPPLRIGLCHFVMKFRTRTAVQPWRQDFNPGSKINWVNYLVLLWYLWKNTALPYSDYRWVKYEHIR